MKSVTSPNHYFLTESNLIPHEIVCPLWESQHSIHLTWLSTKYSKGKKKLQKNSIKMASELLLPSLICFLLEIKAIS